MLKEATGNEADLIRAELAQVQAGVERQRRKRLGTAAVVGVTCCSALQATLESQSFDVVLLDEASQMTEPISLVPLLRARPRSEQASDLGSRSSVNKAEAQLVVQLVLALLQWQGPCSSIGGPGGPAEGRVQQTNTDAVGSARLSVAPHQLGIICFFRGQAILIRQMLASELHIAGAADVQVATVDSFQGAEKDVILLATTTTNPNSEFCSDGARINVAITRARHHLVVFGMADVLAKWRDPRDDRCGSHKHSLLVSAAVK
eukprot:gene11176-11326_t